jgi:hypothetical protein
MGTSDAIFGLSIVAALRQRCVAGSDARGAVATTASSRLQRNTDRALEGYLLFYFNGNLRNGWTGYGWVWGSS